MKGKLKKIELKEYRTKDGKKTFNKIEFTCDVIFDEKGTIKTLKGSYSEDYARRYFSFCGVTTKDLIGKEVECVISKRAYENDKGEERVVNFIRFLNVLDRDGNPVIMPRAKAEDLDF